MIIGVVQACPFSLIFGTKEARVEFSIARPVTGKNKFVIDALLLDEERIEADFGKPLEWLRLDGRASRIQFSKGFDGYKEENRPELIDFNMNYEST